MEPNQKFIKHLSLVFHRCTLIFQFTPKAFHKAKNSQDKRCFTCCCTQLEKQRQTETKAYKLLITTCGTPSIPSMYVISANPSIYPGKSFFYVSSVSSVKPEFTCLRKLTANE